MRIHDLCPEWVKWVVEKHDRVRYEATYPALFEHYYRYWSARREIVAPHTITEIEACRGLVNDRLRIVDEQFARRGFDLGDLEVVLFVGQGTTNGHAFHDHGAFVVWLPVETYTEALFTDVFLAHEIAHALHYRHGPEFYFASMRDRHSISRQFITEGVATYTSGAILDLGAADCLWGGYLSRESLGRWMSQCEDRFPEICAGIVRHYSESMENSGFFCLLNLEDVTESRAGYFAGMRVIAQIMKSQKISIEDLFRYKRHALEEMVHDCLVSLASA